MSILGMVFSVKVIYQIEDLPQLNDWLWDMEAEEEELDRQCQQ